MSRKTKPEEELQSSIKTLVTKLCTSEEFIDQISTTIINIISSKYDEKIKALEDQNVKLNLKLNSQQEIIIKQQEKMEKFEQMLKAKSLRIYGIKEAKNEKCSEAVLSILKKLNPNIDLTLIESCYRIGKLTKNKNRPILIKFTTEEDKRKLYAVKKKLKGTGIVIREDLTKNKANLIKMALERLGENGSVWSKDGNVYVKVKDQEIVKLNNQEDLESMFSQ